MNDERDNATASEEAYRLETFGKVIGGTRKGIVNDDLGAFTDLPRRMGIAARDCEKGGAKK